MSEREREIGDPREENLRVISIRIYRERAFVYARTRVILAEGRWFRAFGHLALLRVSWMKKKKNDKGERGVKRRERERRETESLALFLYRNDGSHESSKPEGRIFSTTRKRREKETAYGGWARNDG